MNKNKILATLAAVGLAAGALLGVAAPALADQPTTAGPPATYSICHATEVVGAKNGWLALPPLPVNAIVAGHGNHAGDIIPVIDPEYPTGQNLTTVYADQGGLTGAQILAAGCPSPEPEPEPEPDPVVQVATAEVTFVAATCDAPEQLVLGAVSHAAFGADTDASALGYNVVATADADAAFADGDPAFKSFVGTLDDVIDPADPACDSDNPGPPATYSICHATEVVGAKNGWLALPPLPVNAIVAGHGNHAGDIIPVIDPEYPTGQNLTTVYADQGGLTGAQILAAGCPDPEPETEVATAVVSFVPATCAAPEQLVLGAVSHAAFGADTDASALGYNVVATADADAEFAAGDGDAGDLTKKTFEGTLDAQLDPASPACDFPTLGLVLPKVTSSPITCVANGSYTLGVETGFDPTHITWTVNGVPNVPSGTYLVSAAQVVTVAAVAVAPNGLEDGWTNPAPLNFTAPVGCELTTLAFTGSSGNGEAGLWITGGLLFLGIAGVYVRRRFTARAE